MVCRSKNLSFFFENDENLWYFFNYLDGEREKEGRGNNKKNYKQEWVDRNEWIHVTKDYFIYFMLIIIISFLVIFNITFTFFKNKELVKIIWPWNFFTFIGVKLLHI